MANYKIVFELHQQQAGDENAKVKFVFNGATVADNVDLTSVDPENPDLFVYDVTSDKIPAADAWHTIRVELVNDFYLDADNDRNIYLHRVGYAYQDPVTGHYVKAAWKELSQNPTSEWIIDAEHPESNITDWTNIRNFNTYDLKFKFTDVPTNEFSGETPGIEVTSRNIAQEITTSFCEWEIAFEKDKVINGFNDVPCGDPYKTDNFS
jgi:hypothetical protein